jgi:rhamnose transport system permease protein
MTAEVVAPVAGPAAGPFGRPLRFIARQRELSLVIVMVALGAFVAIQAPQFLSRSNLVQVSVLASIIGIAAVGQAIVVLTRNVDLSVEAVIGLVAFAVADLLAGGTLPVPAALGAGVVLGLVLGMGNGILVGALKVPAIVATLGTLSIYRGLLLVLAGGKQVTVTDLPAGYTDMARADIAGIPVFFLLAIVIVVIAAVVLRQTRAGRQVYAVGSNPEAAAIIGIRAGLVTFAAFAVCGLLAGVAGILWGMEFGTVNASSATGVTLSVIAAVVVGGVNIFGGSGTVVGAGLGALFLAFIQNALILLRLSQFWLQAIYGIVILVAVLLDAALLRRLQRSTTRRRGA